MSTLLVEVAAELQFHLNLTDSLGAVVNLIKNLQDAASNAEMNTALLRAELDDLAALDSGREKEIRSEVARLTSEIDLQRRQANSEYRNLFRYVISYRREVHDAKLRAYYDGLEQLIRRFTENSASAESPDGAEP